MRVLSVRQPWAYAILRLGKDVENRSTNLAGTYRGPVAIHASKKALPIDSPARSQIHDLSGHYLAAEHPSQLGAILGVIDLVDVHWCNIGCDLVPIDVPGLGSGMAHVTCSPWGEEASYHLVLENPRILQHPLPYQGSLGLRELPTAVEDRIRRELGIDAGSGGHG